MLPAIWWWSVQLYHGSVTGLTFLKYIYKISMTKCSHINNERTCNLFKLYNNGLTRNKILMNEMKVTKHTVAHQ